MNNINDIVNYHSVRVNSFSQLCTRMYACSLKDFIFNYWNSPISSVGHGDSLPLESTDELSTGPTASLPLTVSLSSWMSTLSSISLSIVSGEPVELLVLAGRPALGVEQSRGGLPLSKLVWERHGEDDLSVPSPGLLTNTCTGSEWSFC